MIISKDCNFLIYGAGIEGNRIKDNLTKNGYSVYSFLDGKKTTDTLDSDNKILNLDDIDKIEININESL